MDWFCIPEGWRTAQGYVFDEEALRARSYFNQGDGWITDAMFRVIGHTRNDDDILMIRGANVLRAGTEEYWDRLAVQLRENKYRKVIAWSVGIDADINPVMPASFYECLPKIDHWGARGEMSKLMLKNWGAKDVSVVYCPTLLRGMEAELVMSKPPEFRRILMPTHSAPIKPWQDKLAKQFIQEGAKVVFHFAEGPEMMLALNGLGPTSDWMRSYEGYDAAFIVQPLPFDALIQTMDLCVSTLLHGALPALALGIPTYAVSDSWRMREILLELNLPLLEPKEMVDWKGYNERDFEVVQKAHRIVRNKTAAWLDRISINHVLHEPSVKGPNNQCEG